MIGVDSGGEEGSSTLLYLLLQVIREVAADLGLRVDLMVGQGKGKVVQISKS